MTANPTPEWAKSAYPGVRVDQPTTIPLTVHGETSHPLAILIARLAPLAVAVSEHLDELGEQDTTDLGDIVRDLHKLRRSVETIEEDAIIAMRAAGASWADLANSLDVTRASARERHGRIEAAHAQGLNVEGAAQAAAERAAARGLTSSADVVIVTGTAQVGRVISRITYTNDQD